MFSNKYFNKKYFKDRYFKPVKIYILPPSFGGQSAVYLQHKPTITAIQLSFMLGLNFNNTVSASYNIIKSKDIGLKGNIEAVKYDPNAQQREEDELILMTLSEINKHY